ncbi:MAG: DUF4625 domain-containing protein [Tannerella sp.]|jgi:hypothetical protein|nr:DUF4625 domain-containing protein [Tannerella sp.]
MKAKSIFLITGLTALLFIVCNSCREDSDTTKPVILLIEPADDEVLQIGNENGVHFEVEFSDNEMLASYKVNIHPNFDGHTHETRADSETVDFEYDKSWSLSGKNAAIHHHEIRIPENATPGAYHLMVYCTDAAGNESYIAIHVELSHEEGEEHDHDHEDE